MIRKMLRKALKPILGKRKAAIAAESLDDLAKRVADKHTGGLASRVDEVV